MIVECPECHAIFDDAYRWTFCPHDTFAANDGKNNFRHHVESLLRPAPGATRGRQLDPPPPCLSPNPPAIKVTTWQQIRFWVQSRYYAARDFFLGFE